MLPQAPGGRPQCSWPATPQAASPPYQAAHQSRTRNLEASPGGRGWGRSQPRTGEVSGEKRGPEQRPRPQWRTPPCWLRGGRLLRAHGSEGQCTGGRALLRAEVRQAIMADGPMGGSRSALGGWEAEKGKPGTRRSPQGRARTPPPDACRLQAPPTVAAPPQELGLSPSDPSSSEGCRTAAGASGDSPQSTR